MAYIDNKNTTFYNIFEKERFLVVPDYQRAFEWDDDNFISLISELREIQKVKESRKNLLNGKNFFDFENISSNVDFKSFQLFLGNIVLHGKNIVDGQQRLTSLMIISKAICDIYDGIKSDSNEIHNYVWKLKTFLKNEISPGKYNAMIKTEVVKQKERNINFIKNPNQDKRTKLHKLYSKAKKQFANDNKETLDLIAFKLLNTQFIVLSVENIDASFDIFEKLNSKSTPLKPADLIKNKAMGLLRKTKIDDKNIKTIFTEIYSNLENETGNQLDATVFYRACLMILKATKYKDDSEKSAYLEKNKIFKDEFSKATKDSIEQKIKFIHDMSFVYNKYFVKNSVDKEHINIAFRFLDMSKTVVFSTMTLYICYQFENKKIDKFTWYEIIKWLENYFIGMFTLSNNPAKEVDKIIPDKIKELQKLDEITFMSFKDVVKNSLMKEYIGDDLSAMQGIYKSISKKTFKNKQAIHLLMKLNDEVNLENEEKINKSEDAMISTITEYSSSLEHLFPQNPTKWEGYEDIDIKEIEQDEDIYNQIYQIGNMFLLAKDNNSGLGNKSFTEKKDELLNNEKYVKSKKIIDKLLLIKKSIKELNKWDDADRKERTDKIEKLFTTHDLLNVQ